MGKGQNSKFCNLNLKAYHLSYFQSATVIRNTPMLSIYAQRSSLHLLDSYIHQVVEAICLSITVSKGVYFFQIFPSS